VRYFWMAGSGAGHEEQGTPQRSALSSSEATPAATLSPV
jgi:hypothetical protein